MSHSHPVLYQQDGGVVVLTLNEPTTRNAISPAIVEALVECTERINADLSVGCVILTGAGKGFSSGGNVKQMKERTSLFGGSPAEIRRRYQQGIQRIPLAMYALEAPSIAAVNGAAVGAGCDLASMCDIRIAGRSASFAESFLRVGLVSGDGGAWFLPRAVGMSKACEMTFTGDFVEAEEALRIGLVSKVVDDDKLMEEATRPGAPHCRTAGAFAAPDQAPAARFAAGEPCDRARNGLLDAGAGAAYQGPARSRSRFFREARTEIRGPLSGYCLVHAMRSQAASGLARSARLNRRSSGTGSKAGRGRARPARPKASSGRKCNLKARSAAAGSSVS